MQIIRSAQTIKFIGLARTRLTNVVAALNWDLVGSMSGFENKFKYNTFHEKVQQLGPSM